MTTLPTATLPLASLPTSLESHDTDDHPLHSRVLKALAMQTHLAGKNLRFETRAGRVTLHGKVRSFFLKQMAQETLRGIEGVAHIDNRMTVDWETDHPKQAAAAAS
jgi:osmotically-inducible protein OsmY